MTLTDIFYENGLSQLLDEDKAAALQRLCGLLLKANESVNLTAVRDERGVYVRHFADCAVLARLIPKGARVLDVGCGGGFPALVLAVLREDITVLGMDSTGKKLDFVRSAADSLGLNNLSTLCCRAEEKAVFPLRASFDIVCARAVSALPTLSELCLPYVKLGGRFIAMKTDGSELQSAAKAIETLGGGNVSVSDYTLKDGAESYSRALISLEKIKATPPQYPRKYSQIKSKSL